MRFHAIDVRKKYPWAIAGSYGWQIDLPMRYHIRLARDNFKWRLRMWRSFSEKQLAALDYIE